MLKWLLFALLVLHGLVHLLGPVKAFGLAEVAELTQPISRPVGLLWLLAAVAFVVAAVLLLRSPPSWWIIGLVAVALSLALILGAWTDARFGTLPNLVILVAALLASAAFGPYGLRVEYQRNVQERLADVVAADTVTEADLAHLPDPVQRYLRLSGVVGEPRVHHVRVVLRGRIRAGPDDPWMPFTSVQTNVVDDPARFFFMDARRAGLPVDVLHVYRDGEASMTVRLLSLLPLVDARGPEMNRAETVTLFNDLVLFAPGALIDPEIEWEPVDDHTVRARYTAGTNTVSAVLTFDEEGRIVDFVSDDRMAATSDGFQAMPWSTPVGAYGTLRGAPRMTAGDGVWHAPEGAYAYIELQVLDVEINGPLRGLPGRLGDLAGSPVE